MKIYEKYRENKKKILVSFISVLCFGLLLPSITSCEKSTAGLGYELKGGEFWVTSYTGANNNVVI